MLSKNKIKLIRSLEQKKYRRAHNMFVAEGTKLIEDLLKTLRCKYLIATEEWINNNQPIASKLATLQIEVDKVMEEELKKVSFLKTPQDILAIFEIPQHDKKENRISKDRLYIALDGVQDPGNLGTIIRIADWFGIEDVFCSNDTVDAYNPKTVQATMGALARVKVHYVELPELLNEAAHNNIPIYGTFLDGENMYEGAQLTENGIIVMGNEGNGISSEVEQIVNRKLFIPNYPIGRATSESLNVAIATAVICAEFRRKK